MATPPAIVALAMAFIGLAGCAMEWTKPGATEQELNADQLSCEQEAARAYPVMHVPNSYNHPAPSSRLETNCVEQSGLTNCNATGYGGAPPPAQRTDVNDYNRASAVKACLVSRGYAYKRVAR